MGVARTTNEQVQETLLSDEVRLHQLKLLGRTLGRPPDHPARIVLFNRFLQPRTSDDRTWRSSVLGATRHSWRRQRDDSTQGDLNKIVAGMLEDG